MTIILRGEKHHEVSKFRSLVFRICKYSTLVRQLTLILLKSFIRINFNKLLFKTISFKCHAHFLHSSGKRAVIPRVTGIFLSLMWREMLVYKVSHPAACIGSGIELSCVRFLKVCVASVQFLFENA
jgi:hypothetical protein